ncbi:MAG: hypothetical protein IKE17_10525 [Clostridia bacterium]|nr:hypothetical protein [Clostridia bacterium]
MAGITLVDGDVSLNPLRRTDLDVTHPPRAGEMGGLGILMAQKTMGMLKYGHENGFNILTIHKRI